LDSTASTSTVDCGAAAGAPLAPLEVLEVEDVGPAEAGPVAGVVGDGLAPAWPKMVEMMFPRTDI
jgi:hypothetical protein